jgi:hypothetical protein
MPVRTIPISDFSGGLNVSDKEDTLYSSRSGLAYTPLAKDVLSIGKALYQRLGFARWLDTGHYHGRVVLLNDDWRGYGPVVFLVDDDVTTNVDQDQFSATRTAPSVPRTPRQPPVGNAYTFSILTPDNQSVNINYAAAITVTWTQRKGARRYLVRITDFDTGAEAHYKADAPPVTVTQSPTSAVYYQVPAGTLEASKTYLLKVWAILKETWDGGIDQMEQATNNRTFTTKLRAPTNLAPVGEIATLTPTFTCDAVAKAVRYKVKIYDATGTTVLHTSIPLLLPSYPLGPGVLTDYATKQWSVTAYPDAACTAAYGVESEKVRIYKIELDDTLADATEGTAYTGTVAATGGTGPYTYAVTSGTLPAGLSLSSGGSITGTPTTAATSDFTVTATDANGDTGSRAYSVMASNVLGNYAYTQTGTRYGNIPRSEDLTWNAGIGAWGSTTMGSANLQWTGSQWRWRFIWDNLGQYIEVYRADANGPQNFTDPWGNVVTVTKNP